ncbi:MAG: sulfur transferase domain-containing protein [Vicinamibacterales bacterium]
MRFVPATIAALVFATTFAVAQEKQTRAGISNYTKVDAVVACGGATEMSALDGLKADGFKSVINLRLASENGANIPENQAKAKALGLNYFHLPLSGASPDPAIVDQFLGVVSNKANQPVYIHCASANRVGAVWLVKRVLQDGWAVEKATAEAKAIGLSAPGLEKFALEYIASHKE